MPEPITQPTSVQAPRPSPAPAPGVQPPVVKTPVPGPAAAPVCDETTKKAKEDFKKKGIYGPRNLSPPETGIGAFWAMYLPYSNMLFVMILGKTQFIDGLKINGSKVTTQTKELVNLATLINEIKDITLANTLLTSFEWTKDEKAKARGKLRARISETVEIWQKPGFTFMISDTCWEDILAKPYFLIAVEEIGEAKFFDPYTKDKRDNLQINLVKVPDDYSKVHTEINNALIKKWQKDPGWVSSISKYSVTPSAYVSATQNPTGITDRGYSVMTLASDTLDNSPANRKASNSMLKRSVFFQYGKSTVPPTEKVKIKAYLDNFLEGDKDPGNSTVKLIGHASASGKSEFNRQLAEKRVEAMRSYLLTLGLMKTNEQIKTENMGTAEMEKASAENPDEALLESEFQRVDVVVGTGELQNTVAHEFGHVFGLRDEYVTKAGEKGTGKPLGTEVGHSKMVRDAGIIPSKEAVKAENSDNMMSMGNEVRKQHYATFGWALNELTKKNWIIKS